MWIPSSKTQVRVNLRSYIEGPSWDVTLPNSDLLKKTCLTNATPSVATESEAGYGCNREEKLVTRLRWWESRALCTSWQSNLPLPCPLPLWVTAHLLHPGCSPELRCRMTALNHSTLRMAPAGLTGAQLASWQAPETYILLQVCHPPAINCG